jgi:hypothetical protein
LDTGDRSLLLNGVEQYTATALSANGLVVCRLDTAGTLIPGSMKHFNTNASPAAQDALAVEIDAAAVKDLVVVSSNAAIGTACFDAGTNLRTSLQAIGVDVNSLEGILATGGNNGFKSRIPVVMLGKRGLGANAGVTVFTNGSTNAGPAEYQDWLTGNTPAHGSAPQWGDFTVIEGGSIRTSSVTADKISVAQLSAITADMGTLNAGEIRGGLIVGPLIGSSTDAATLGGVFITTAGLFLYSSAGLNTGYMAPSGAGFLGAPATFYWTATGGVNVAGVTFSDGSIAASALNVATLSAITADMGTLTAGEINGGRIITGPTSGTHLQLSPTGIRAYNGATQRVQILSDGSGWMGAAASFAWTNAGAVSIDGARINALSVDTAQINNLAVATGKIDNLAVDTGKVAGSAITTAKRQDMGTQSSVTGTTANANSGSGPVTFNANQVTFTHSLNKFATAVVHGSATLWALWAEQTSTTQITTHAVNLSAASSDLTHNVDYW